MLISIFTLTISAFKQVIVLSGSLEIKVLLIMENSDNNHFDPREFLGVKIFFPLEHENIFSGAAELTERVSLQEIEK